MPGLEILADDVRCTHGATSGQIEPEELFYLLSRGIPERVAKALVVKGFLNEVVDRLPGATLTEHLHEQIASHLWTMPKGCEMWIWECGFRNIGGQQPLMWRGRRCRVRTRVSS